MNTSLRINLTRALRGTAIKRGALFGAILITALLAFEIFNYSTTAFALTDVLGELQTAGLRWSTILALAFCGIDFAGIARLFTPQQGRDEPAEVWYLFGAWLLAAGFNAVLTWWGVSVAILNHTSEGSILIGQSAMTRVVPVLVAVMVWMIRVLIIGTFSLAGENMFSMAEARAGARPSYRPLPSTNRLQPGVPFPRPAPKPLPAMRSVIHPGGPSATAEPTYQPVGMSARPREDNAAVRR
jgi:hypothetical protein